MLTIKTRKALSYPTSNGLEKTQRCFSRFEFALGWTFAADVAVFSPPFWKAVESTC